MSLKMIKKFFINTFTANLAIKWVLMLHSWCYKLAGRFGTILNHGFHPKIDIMGYKQWFVDNTRPSDVVLDVGSHIGDMASALADKVSFVYGIEVEKKYFVKSQEMVQKANIEFILGDATSFDFSKCRPITCVTLSNILEHIKDRVEFLRRIMSNVPWANSEKKILIRVPLIERDWITIYKKQMGLSWKLDPTHFTEYTFHEFKQELDQAGINILNFRICFGEIWAICSWGE